MKDKVYFKMIYRFCILKDKINFGLPLNDLDKTLIEILDEYDFLVDNIDCEQNEINKKLKERNKKLKERNKDR